MAMNKKEVVRDRISIRVVPDEILVLIVSKLSIEEAARTSVLSRRWEKLWIHYQGNLVFDATSKLLAAKYRNRPQIKLDCLKSMNRVLNSLCSSSLNSLIVRFSCLSTDELEFGFDTLVDFVMAKRSIRILEFDMYHIPNSFTFFSFPVRFYAWIKHHPLNISALTSLSFHHVSLTDDTVEYFVSNCPLLETLCVRVSNKLSNLRIISPKLKYLKILDVSGMKCLHVSAPNLVSLDYEDRSETKLHLSNLPNLVEVSIGQIGILAHMSDSLSPYLAQIHTLKLYFVASRMIYMDFTLLTPPNYNVVFSNLKHLIFKVMIQFEERESFLGFASSLVEASPTLEKFTLYAHTFVRDEEIVGLHRMTTPTRKQYSHQRVKVVELLAFTGVIPEVELLVYFVQNFTSSLEQVIIDTRTPPYKIRRHLSKMRRKRGRQLRKLIPPGVNFVLI